MKTETNNLLTVKNFATQLGLKSRNKAYSTAHIYKMLKSKQIDPKKYTVKIDGFLFIRKSALQRYEKT